MAWISVKEARQRLDNAVGLSTIYKLLSSGKLKGTKIGGKVLVDDGSIDRLVDSGRVLVLAGVERNKPFPPSRKAV